MFKIAYHICILAIFCYLGGFSRSLEASSRPPQFVMLAFDNCQENQTWRQVTDFLEEMNSLQADRLRFTFFLSGVALLGQNHAHQYQNPSVVLTESTAIARDPQRSRFQEKARALAQGRSFLSTGRSNIGFGGRAEDLIERVSHINNLFRRGNEIASHAVGHFAGARWSVQMWQHEMDEFNRLVDRVGPLNGVPNLSFDFNSKDIMGFRAPYLQGSQELISVLSGLNYRYDTSDTRQGWNPTSWPKHYPGTGSKKVWNFGLGFIHLHGKTNSRGAPLKIPAMDYNFCFNQDKGCPEKYPQTLVGAEKDAYDMLLSYLNYFENNYNGNRAPLHIGHHFQQYRGGHYNRALFEFARVVCALPEVRCVTYSELADFMDRVSEPQLRDYQLQKFPTSNYRPSLKDLIRKTRF